MTEISTVNAPTLPAAASDDLDRAIDALFVATAATEAAGALLVAQACLMQIGTENATAALREGRGVVFHAVVAATEMQTLVAAFERDYPGADGWQAARQAILDAFGAEWADATLTWALQVASAGAAAELDPGTDTLVRWALSLPVMGGLMPALDALMSVGAPNGGGEAARGAAEAVRGSILAAVGRGVSRDWLERALGTWASATGGPAIVFTCQP
jgi:hypothetical protein